MSLSRGCFCFRVEGPCNLLSVPLRHGERFFLRTLGAVRDAHPAGCHLHADPAAAHDERLVRAEFDDRGGYQALEAVRVGAMRGFLG